MGTKDILRDVNMTVGRGSIAALIGPNGAGKTTLLRTACGILDVVHGEFSWDGTRIDPKSTSWRRRVAYVPDDSGVFPELTGREHFLLMADLFGIERADAVRRYQALAAIFSLEESLDTRAGRLSYGFQRRLGLALALLHDADVYLLDEPFNGLDIDNVGAFRAVVEMLSLRGRIILIASHYFAALLSLCNGVWEIAEGSIVNTLDPGAGSFGSRIDDLVTATDPTPSKVELPWIARID